MFTPRALGQDTPLCPFWYAVPCSLAEAVTIVDFCLGLTALELNSGSLSGVCSLVFGSFCCTCTMSLRSVRTLSLQFLWRLDGPEGCPLLPFPWYLDLELQQAHLRGLPQDRLWASHLCEAWLLHPYSTSSSHIPFWKHLVWHCLRAISPAHNEIPDLRHLVLSFCLSRFQGSLSPGRKLNYSKRPQAVP